MNVDICEYKKSASYICWTLLASIVLMNILSVAADLVPEIATSLVASHIIVLIALMFPFGFLASEVGVFKANEPKKQLSGKTQFYLFGASFLVILFGNILSKCITTFFEMFGIKFSTYDVPESDNIFYTCVLLIFVSIIPALSEEFVFRRVIFNILKKFNTSAAIFISAFLFALFHGNVSQFIFAFFLGLYLAFVYVKTQSIKLPILIHFFNNALVVVLNFLSTTLSDNFSVILDFIQIVILVLVGSFSFFRLFKSGLLSLKEENSCATISFGNCLGAFFTRCSSIIFIVIILLTVIVSTKFV